MKIVKIGSLIISLLAYQNMIFLNNTQHLKKEWLKEHSVIMDESESQMNTVQYVNGHVSLKKSNAKKTKVKEKNFKEIEREIIILNEKNELVGSGNRGTEVGRWMSILSEKILFSEAI